MIAEIEQKLSEILKDKKNLSNMIEENQRKKEQLLDEVFMDAISVLDAFSREEKVIEDHEWNQSEDSQKAIKRLLNAKKKLNTMLEKYDVKKIVFEDGMSNDDLCSVTDTEPDAEKPNGYILSIDRNGLDKSESSLLNKISFEE